MNNQMRAVNKRQGEMLAFLCCSIIVKALELKGAQSRSNGFKRLAKLSQIRCLQSLSIFSILNQLCSFMVYYYLFDVFLSL